MLVCDGRQQPVQLTLVRMATAAAHSDSMAGRGGGAALQLDQGQGQVVFPEITAGRRAHRGLRLENLTSSTYSWSLSAAAAEGARTGEPAPRAFSFGRLAGVLGPQATTVLDAYYDPEAAGHHSQRWTISYRANTVLPTEHNAGQLSLVLHGTATAAAAAAAAAPGAVAPRHTAGQSLSVEPSFLDFAPAHPGETVQLSAMVKTSEKNEKRKTATRG